MTALVSVPSKGDGWLHEVKSDGYRLQLHKDGTDVIIYSRNGNDFTGRFPATPSFYSRWLHSRGCSLTPEGTGLRRDGPRLMRIRANDGHRKCRLCNEAEIFAAPPSTVASVGATSYLRD